MTADPDRASDTVSRSLGCETLTQVAQLLPGLAVRHVAYSMRTPASLGVQWRITADLDGVVLARADGRFLLHFPGLANFVVAESFDAVDISAPTSTRPETLNHLLLDQVLPRLLAHRGALVMHAGAAVVGDVAVALAGATGVGKSTLTAALLAAGGSLLSDDGLVVEPVGPHPWVRAVYPSLRLWPDSLGGVFDAVPATAPMAHYSAKRRMLLGEKEAPAGPHWPLAALFVLGPGSNDSTDIGSMSLAPSEACMALVENSFALDPTDRGWLSRRFAQAAALARSLPVLRLAYPRRFECLPQVVEHIREQSGRLSAATGAVA